MVSTCVCPISFSNRYDLTFNYYSYKYSIFFNQVILYCNCRVVIETGQNKATRVNLGGLFEFFTGDIEKFSQFAIFTFQKRKLLQIVRMTKF